ncbi:MAG: phosphoribosylglycinamide formyltransferase [Phycisphaerae bacterium]|nr:phosphoribosylglycinamide formyltransferase [Phycisphaerae bacterium]
MSKQIIIHTDGGSRGNPGPGGAGFTLEDEKGNQLMARGIYLGETTNNIAEYTAIKEALKAAEELGAESIKLFSDSELLVRQLNGQYKVKSDNLKDYYIDCMALLGGFKGWQVTHVYREQNSRADALANEAMDKKADVQYGISASDPKGQTVRLGILLSGGGRTMINIHDEIDAGRLNAEIVLVISSRLEVKGNDRARKIGLEPVIIRKKDYPDIADFSRRIEEELDKANVDLVIQAGWLCLWRIPKHYDNRVMNIHPALLPGFGGQGMWGHHVHEAVLKAGCKVSGCTVHFCTNEYDAGPIIVQRVCQVKDDDDADTLAARVFQQECLAYPEAIQLFAEGRLKVENSLVKCV